MHVTCALAVLLLLLEEGCLIDAEPVVSRPENMARSNWCSEHRTLHRRIDAVEEVEKTIEHLYSEVKTLMDTMANPAWYPPADTSNPAIDIFEEDSR
ncbi:placenta-specific protein 9 isoform X3 [Pleurodeles waltl]|uniref:placenta-specific protein 9 isoform X3 n=1 Tax=Pleurodeles waltl TaxID=8319 RepID=UPI003709AFC0